MAIHDFNCDGKYWRYCSRVTKGGDGKACVYLHNRGGDKKATTAAAAAGATAVKLKEDDEDDEQQQQQQQQPQQPQQQAQQQQAQQQQQGPPETTMPVTKTEAAEDCLDCIGGNPSARKLVGEEHGWCKRLEAPTQEGSAHCAGFYEEKDSSYRLCVGAGEGGCTAVGEFLDCCPGAAAARD